MKSLFAVLAMGLVLCGCKSAELLNAKSLAQVQCVIDNTNSSNVAFRTWLEVDGAVVTSPVECSIKILDMKGIEIDCLGSTNHDPRGVFWLQWDYADTKKKLDAFPDRSVPIYFAHVCITFDGHTTPGGGDFSLKPFTSVPVIDIRQADGKNPTVLRIANYDYVLPSWWESVNVELPENLEDGIQVAAFVRERYGKDTGTKKTWKAALKTWAIAGQRLNLFPVYLAHCYMSGEEYKRAAEIFVDLYNLADTQKERRDSYRVQLALHAGETYMLLKDSEKAASWYARSAEYVGNTNFSIRFYAKRSAEALELLKKK